MSAGAAKYPDLRYKFIRGLMRHEEYQRKHSFLKGAAEWTAKAIVSLDLTEQPVRSVKQAMTLNGVGHVIAEKLKKISQDESISPDPPRPGILLSSGSALLVAMLDLTEAMHLESPDNVALVDENELKDRCAEICQEKMIQWSSSGSSAKLPVYELLPEGFNIAVRIRGAHPVGPLVRRLVQPKTGTSADCKSAIEGKKRKVGKKPPRRRPDFEVNMFSSESDEDNRPSSSKVSRPKVSRNSKNRGTTAKAPDGDALYSTDDGEDG